MANAETATRTDPWAPGGRLPGPTSILSVDVEDWFHILDLPSTPELSEWDRLPSRVEKNFIELLDLFSGKDVRVTCFFLGWVGQRFPHLVKEAVRRGHEIASHGQAHRIVYRMTREEFRQDVEGSRKLLEDISGLKVSGYRSPGFSITDRTPWFFEVLSGAGYEYDSSVFPAPREHGGIAGASRAPYEVPCGSKSLVEIPITVASFLGKPICFFGGGYLRLFPYRLVRAMARRVHAEGRPVVFYVHPREIDPEQPRLPMGLRRRFKCYVNLRTTEGKLRRIIQDFSVTTFKEYLAGRNAEPAEA